MEIFGTLFIILVFASQSLHGYLVDDNPYRHIEILDNDGKYQLEWLVDWPESRVYFNVTVKTRGYVGFGLSRKGKMSGADIVIGGVLPSGLPYFSDRHAVGNQLPVEDPSQDWNLHESWEKAGTTFLSFSRSFETCDEDHDLPIDGNVIGIIWSFGEKDDDIEYHFQNRGVFYAYLLDADLAPRELRKTAERGISQGEQGRFGDWKVWRIPRSQVVPQQDTTYICEIHKSPGNRKQHIVGFRSILPTELEQRHIHHFLLHRCIVPEGQDASRYFEHLQGHREECYILSQPAGRIPTQYCTEVVHVWAVGQRPNFFPDHVGIPMYPNEYFMLQMHYDNPEVTTGIELNHALEIFYTDNLRKHDAGMLTFGELTPASPSIMIPPNSLAHQIYGHCGSGCTQSMFPPEGIHVFASNLHTHLAGRGVRLIHIRNNQELPWISYDDNYNFNFQQIRILREERTLLPGDALIDRCIYGNTDRQGNVTVGGFSSRNEMCTGFLWYYPKMVDRAVCRSLILEPEYHQFLQIFNTTWSNEQREMVVTSPIKNAGLLVSEVGNFKMDWTIENREKLQNYHRYLPQVSMCPSLILEDEEENDQNSRWGNKRNNLKRVSSRRKYAQSSRNPEYEFLSIYPKSIVPYERPNACATATKKGRNRRF